MKLSKTELSKIANGDICILNDSSVENLKKVLAYCFPQSIQKPVGDTPYYKKFKGGNWKGHRVEPENAKVYYSVSDILDTETKIDRTIKKTKEFVFENSINTNIVLTITAETLSISIDILRNEVINIEDYIYTDDKSKVLS